MYGWTTLTDVGNSVASIATPEGWSYAAFGVACVGMMWYFNSAGHRRRIGDALDKDTEQKRLLALSQTTIAEALELKHMKGEITDKDKSDMYALMFKSNPKMQELRPDDKGVKNPVTTRLFGVGATLRTKWPFRSRAEARASEAVADHALFVNSIKASKK